MLISGMSMWKEAILQSSIGPIQISIVDRAHITLSLEERSGLKLGRDHIQGMVYLKKDGPEYNLTGPTWQALSVSRVVLGKPFEKKPLTERQQTTLIQLILNEINAWAAANQDVIRDGVRMNVERKLADVREDMTRLRAELGALEAKEASLVSEIVTLK